MKNKVNPAEGANVAANDDSREALEDCLRELNQSVVDLSTALEDAEDALDLLQTVCDDLDEIDNLDENSFDEDDAFSVGLTILASFGRIAMLLFPGEPPKLIRTWEAYLLMPKFSDRCECIENFHKMQGLNFYYRKDQVVSADGEDFLLGPAVVCSVDSAANLRSLTGEEIYCINRYVDHFDKVLTDDEKDFPALQLPL